MIEHGIPYTQLDLGAMFRRYNEEAVKRGVPRMHARPKDRADMCKALALLMAQPKPKTPPAPVANVPARVRKHNAIRAVVVEELCAIDYFESAQGGKRITFGRTYADILARVKARLPNSKITGPKLRVHAANIRNRKPGYENLKLPDRRPHSSKGVRHVKTKRR